MKEQPVWEWEEAIEAFEAADRLHPPPAGAILFVGSSSIRLWRTLAEDFAEFPVVNRCFGGSRMRDSLRAVDRIVIPCRPRQVVVYAGDNDIAFGGTPERMADAFRQFVAKIHDALPETRVTYMAMKPCASRWAKIDLFKEGNRLVEAFAETDARLSFADTFSPLLDADGKPDDAFFLDDRLHLNAQGYAVWRRVVRPHLR